MSKNNGNHLHFIKHRFKKQEFKKHFHENYSIGLVLNGIHKLQIEKDDIAITQGEIKVLNPYDLHMADGNIIWEYINFMPDSQLIKHIAQDLCDDIVDCEIRFKPLIQDKKATKYFLKLYQSLDNNIEYEENFILFLSYLLQHYAFKNLKVQNIPVNIKYSLDYIYTHFLDEISLDTLAKLSHLSKYHFIKVFKEKTGLTPHQYIMALKIEYAMQLISKNLPLSQIAYECGFSDQSHFIRTFKKHYGFTPSLVI